MSTRRDFLKASAAVALGLGMVGTVKAQELDAPPAPTMGKVSKEQQGITKVENSFFWRTYNLVAGWNLIGVNWLVPVSAFPPEVESAWEYKAATETWRVWINDPAYADLMTLRYLRPGFGYWVKTTGACMIGAT